MTGLVLGAISLAQSPRAILDQAIDDFSAGRLSESVSGFDEVATLVPSVAPQLWQRGIALYYVGRYQDCREMFEAHRTVNPNDVENAVWHFLCVARQESPVAALAALLPVGPDSRMPMTEIYRMFQNNLRPDDVMKVAQRAPSRVRLRAVFYAHLYIGLYYEAIGSEAMAREHLVLAAEDTYARVGGYMHTVARVHVDQLNGR
ncbi:MAG: hypothetical protein VX262_08765 [Acidobacteriota bacterium]|nr:hypothetical protein [Acidobacteriota bacterium]